MITRSTDAGEGVSERASWKNDPKRPVGVTQTRTHEILICLF